MRLCGNPGPLRPPPQELRQNPTFGSSRHLAFPRPQPAVSHRGLLTSLAPGLGLVNPTNACRASQQDPSYTSSNSSAHAAASSSAPSSKPEQPRTGTKNAWHQALEAIVGALLGCALVVLSVVLHSWLGRQDPRLHPLLPVVSSKPVTCDPSAAAPAAAHEAEASSTLAAPLQDAVDVSAWQPDAEAGPTQAAPVASSASKLGFVRAVGRFTWALIDVPIRVVEWVLLGPNPLEPYRAVRVAQPAATSVAAATAKAGKAAAAASPTAFPAAPTTDSRSSSQADAQLLVQASQLAAHSTAAEPAEGLQRATSAEAEVQPSLMHPTLSTKGVVAAWAGASKEWLTQHMPHIPALTTQEGAAASQWLTSTLPGRMVLLDLTSTALVILTVSMTCKAVSSLVAVGLGRRKPTPSATAASGFDAWACRSGFLWCDLPPAKCDLAPPKCDLAPPKCDLPPPKCDLPPPKCDVPPAPYSVTPRGMAGSMLQQRRTHIVEKSAAPSSSSEGGSVADDAWLDMLEEASYLSVSRSRRSAPQLGAEGCGDDAEEEDAMLLAALSLVGPQKVWMELLHRAQQSASTEAEPCDGSTKALTPTRATPVVPPICICTPPTEATATQSSEATVSAAAAASGQKVGSGDECISAEEVEAARRRLRQAARNRALIDRLQAEMKHVVASRLLEPKGASVTTTVADSETSKAAANETAVPPAAVVVPFEAKATETALAPISKPAAALTPALPAPTTSSDLAEKGVLVQIKPTERVQLTLGPSKDDSERVTVTLCPAEGVTVTIMQPKQLPAGSPIALLPPPVIEVTACSAESDGSAASPAATAAAAPTDSSLQPGKAGDTAPVGSSTALVPQSAFSAALAASAAAASSAASSAAAAASATAAVAASVGAVVDRGSISHPSNLASLLQLAQERGMQVRMKYPSKRRGIDQAGGSEPAAGITPAAAVAAAAAAAPTAEPAPPAPAEVQTAKFEKQYPAVLESGAQAKSPATAQAQAQAEAPTSSHEAAAAPAVEPPSTDLLPASIAAAAAAWKPLADAAEAAAADDVASAEGKAGDEGEEVMVAERSGPGYEWVIDGSVSKRVRTGKPIETSASDDAEKPAASKEAARHVHDTTQGSSPSTKDTVSITEPRHADAELLAAQDELCQLEAAAEKAHDTLRDAEFTWLQARAASELHSSSRDESEEEEGAAREEAPAVGAFQKHLQRHGSKLEAAEEAAKHADARLLVGRERVRRAATAKWKASKGSSSALDPTVPGPDTAAGPADALAAASAPAAPSIAASTGFDEAAAQQTDQQAVPQRSSSSAVAVPEQQGSDTFTAMIEDLARDGDALDAYLRSTSMPRRRRQRSPFQSSATASTAFPGTAAATDVAAEDEGETVDTDGKQEASPAASAHATPLAAATTADVHAGPEADLNSAVSAAAAFTAAAANAMGASTSTTAAITTAMAAAAAAGMRDTATSSKSQEMLSAWAKRTTTFMEVMAAARAVQQRAQQVATGNLKNAATTKPVAAIEAVVDAAGAAPASTPVMEAAQTAEPVGDITTKDCSSSSSSRTDTSAPATVATDAAVASKPTAADAEPAAQPAAVDRGTVSNSKSPWVFRANKDLPKARPSAKLHAESPTNTMSISRDEVTQPRNESPAAQAPPGSATASDEASTEAAASSTKAKPSPSPASDRKKRALRNTVLVSDSNGTCGTGAAAASPAAANTTAATDELAKRVLAESPEPAAKALPAAHAPAPTEGSPQPAAADKSPSPEAAVEAARAVAAATPTTPSSSPAPRTLHATIEKEDVSSLVQELQHTKRRLRWQSQDTAPKAAAEALLAILEEHELVGSAVMLATRPMLAGVQRATLASNVQLQDAVMGLRELAELAAGSGFGPVSVKLATRRGGEVVIDLLAPKPAAPSPERASPSPEPAASPEPTTASPQPAASSAEPAPPVAKSKTEAKPATKSAEAEASPEPATAPLLQTLDTPKLSTPQQFGYYVCTRGTLLSVNHFASTRQAHDMVGQLPGLLRSLRRGNSDVAAVGGRRAVPHHRVKLELRHTLIWLNELARWMNEKGLGHMEAKVVNHHGEQVIVVKLPTEDSVASSAPTVTQPSTPSPSPSPAPRAVSAGKNGASKRGATQTASPEVDANTTSSSNSPCPAVGTTNNTGKNSSSSSGNSAAATWVLAPTVTVTVSDRDLDMAGGSMDAAAQRLLALVEAFRSPSPEVRAAAEEGEHAYFQAVAKDVRGMSAHAAKVGSPDIKVALVYEGYNGTKGRRRVEVVVPPPSISASKQEAAATATAPAAAAGEAEPMAEAMTKAETAPKAKPTAETKTKTKPETKVAKADTEVKPVAEAMAASKLKTKPETKAPSEEDVEVVAGKLRSLMSQARKERAAKSSTEDAPKAPERPEATPAAPASGMPVAVADAVAAAVPGEDATMQAVVTQLRHVMGKAAAGKAAATKAAAQDSNEVVKDARKVHEKPEATPAATKTEAAVPGGDATVQAVATRLRDVMNKAAAGKAAAQNSSEEVKDASKATEKPEATPAAPKAKAVVPDALTSQLRDVLRKAMASQAAACDKPAASTPSPSPTKDTPTAVDAVAVEGKERGNSKGASKLGSSGKLGVRDGEGGMYQDARDNPLEFNPYSHRAEYYGTFPAVRPVAGTALSSSPTNSNTTTITGSGPTSSSDDAAHGKNSSVGDAMGTQKGESGSSSVEGKLVELAQSRTGQLGGSKWRAAATRVAPARSVTQSSDQDTGVAHRVMREVQARWPHQPSHRPHQAASAAAPVGTEVATGLDKRGGLNRDRLVVSVRRPGSKPPQGLAAVAPAEERQANKTTAADQDTDQELYMVWKKPSAATTANAGPAGSSKVDVTGTKPTAAATAVAAAVGLGALAAAAQPAAALTSTSSSGSGASSSNGEAASRAAYVRSHDVDWATLTLSNSDESGSETDEPAAAESEGEPDLLDEMLDGIEGLASGIAGFVDDVARMLVDDDTDDGNAASDGQDDDDVDVDVDGLDEEVVDEEDGEVRHRWGMGDVEDDEDPLSWVWDTQDDDDDDDDDD